VFESRIFVDDRGRRVYLGEAALKVFAREIVRMRENRRLHYKTTFQDLPISVENRKGSVRSGENDDGTEWRTKMTVPYGYLRGTKGADGDGVDVFVGPNEDAAYAYVVHSNNPDSGEFDEDKVMLGFDSEQSAKSCFFKHYDDPKFFGGIDAIPMWKFREQVFVKKETGKKLVASKNYGGQAHIFTGMRRSMLGHHPDVMENPEVREVIRKTGSGYQVRSEKGKNLSSPNLSKSAAKKRLAQVEYFKHREGAALQLPPEFFEEPEGDVQESLEHGVKGQKWGVRRTQYQPGRSKYAMRRELMADPHTMNMMVVANHATRYIAKAKAQSDAKGEQKPPQEHHEQAKEALKELGFKVLEAIGRVTGLERLTGAIVSAVKSPTGQKLFLHTDHEGNSRLTMDKKGKQPVPISARKARTSVRENGGDGAIQGLDGKKTLRTITARRAFEGRLSAFLDRVS